LNIASCYRVNNDQPLYQGNDAVSGLFAA